jgi:hypothetical protein
VLVEASMVKTMKKMFGLHLRVVFVGFYTRILIKIMGKWEVVMENKVVLFLYALLRIKK